MRQRAAVLLVPCMIVLGVRLGFGGEKHADRIQKLKTGTEEERAEAALLLKSCKGAIPALLEALRKDRSDEVKLWAAFALGELADKSAADPLLKILTTTEEQTERLWLAMGEDKKGGKTPKEKVKGDVVRRNIVWALGKIGDPKAVDAIVAEAKTAKDWEIRYYGAGALGRIGDPRALPVLGELAKSDPHQREWESSYIVREAAKKAIEAIREKTKGGQGE